jgi:hypothetical protein
LQAYPGSRKAYFYLKGLRRRNRGQTAGRSPVSEWNLNFKVGLLIAHSLQRIRERSPTRGEIGCRQSNQTHEQTDPDIDGGVQGTETV